MPLDFYELISYICYLLKDEPCNKAKCKISADIRIAILSNNIAVNNLINSNI